MNLEELKEILKEKGYDREEDLLIQYADKVIVKKDFSDKTLNHTVLKHSQIFCSNFDRAAVTGSIFTDCKFFNCSMNQSDFEFCEFKQCEFITNKKVISSFNNSTFIETYFISVPFYSATFTGAYFENCHFDNVSISFSTLENALFRNCHFQNMDMRELNLDYIELENPIMQNVVMPMAQIPYMFGCLQYLENTTDDVRISSTGEDEITVQEYLTNVVPILIEYFTEKKEYFALANLYISQKNMDNALFNLREGMINAVVQSDFRMIKFYCKLITQSKCFNTHQLRNLYHQICRLLPLNGNTGSATKNYIRNIGEIKYILFDYTSKPTLLLSFFTNLYFHQTDKVALVIKRFFDMAKMDSKNSIEMHLLQNSPLSIEVKVNGEEDNLVILLPLLLLLVGIPAEHLQDYPHLTKGDVLLLNEENSRYYEQIIAFRQECEAQNINLELIEYYMDNFVQSAQISANTIYYYNRNFRKEPYYIS